jgi:hypothetical protein
VATPTKTQHKLFAYNNIRDDDGADDDDEVIKA